MTENAQHKTADETNSGTTQQPKTVIYRPRNCHELEPTVYNVASWHQLCGLEVVHEEFGSGTVERTNCMSKDVWARFNGTLRIVDMEDVELPTDQFELTDSDNPSYEY